MNYLFTLLLIIYSAFIILVLYTMGELTKYIMEKNEKELGVIGITTETKLSFVRTTMILFWIMFMTVTVYTIYLLVLKINKY